MLKNIIGLGRWVLPGGGLIKGESHLRAVCREAKEEIGLDLNPRKLKQLCVLPGKNRLRPGKRVYYLYPFENVNLVITLQKF